MVTCITIQQGINDGDAYHHMQNHHTIISLSYVAILSFKCGLEGYEKFFLITFPQAAFSQDSF